MSATIIPLRPGDGPRPDSDEERIRREFADDIARKIAQLPKGSQMRTLFETSAKTLGGAAPGCEGDTDAVSQAAVGRLLAFLRGEVAVLPEHHPLRQEYLEQLHDLSQKAGA